MPDDQNESQKATEAFNEDRKRQLNALISLSDRFGDSVTSAFAKNVAEGKKFDAVLKSVRQSLVETGLKMALAPLQLGLSQSMKGLSTGVLEFAADRINVIKISLGVADPYRINPNKSRLSIRGIG